MLQKPKRERRFIDKTIMTAREQHGNGGKDERFNEIVSLEE